MKHIHFVIYRLKSIIYLLLLFIFIFLFINSFYFIICIYSDIKFIKPLNDVKIQRKTITFTKHEKDRTVFINKMINSGIMRMFIFFLIFIFKFSILLAKCYASAQIIVGLLVSEIFFFYCNDFIFHLFNYLMRNRHCI
jgi:hypothetical protein